VTTDGSPNAEEERRGALVKHDSSKHGVTSRRQDLFDRLFDDWPEVSRCPVVLWPEHGLDSRAVEEFTEDGALLVRVELAGVDPEKDVEVSVEDNILHIGAQRREETKTEQRNYVRRELRYGSFHRDLPLPKGIAEADVKASYKDGIVRVPAPAEHPAPASVKIPIEKG
jgi:HSP20 family protein